MRTADVTADVLRDKKNMGKVFCCESEFQLKAAARELTFGNIDGASMGSNANSEQISLKNCLWSLFVCLVHSETVSMATLLPANSGVKLGLRCHFQHNESKRHHLVKE